MYVCPRCKGTLELREEALSCRACNETYPIKDGIPDFILENLAKSTSPVLRGVSGIDRLARIYETKLWYPVVLNLYGGLGAPSLEDLTRTIAEMVEIDQGLILDVACGPGTLGRRIASYTKKVYGFDISMGMLHKGAAYVKEEQIPNVHFARARVEAIPFPNNIFDAAICGGALHLFPDTVFALREIGRTMKEKAPLAVITFTAGDKGILKFRRIRQHIRQDHGIQVFKVADLNEYLANAGFENFQPKIYGSILTFHAQKAGSAESKHQQLPSGRLCTSSSPDP